MNSGGYYSNTYGKTKPNFANEVEKDNYENRMRLDSDGPPIMLNNNYDSNDEEDDYGDRTFSNEQKSYRYNDNDEEYEMMRREREYLDDRNGMHMKFDIVHQDPLYDGNHIYRLKKNESMRQNGKQNDYYIKNDNDSMRQNGKHYDYYNKNENVSMRQNGKHYDYDNNNENYEVRSANNNPNNFDPAKRKPAFCTVAVLLNSFPLSTEEVEDGDLADLALNKYIKVGKDKMKNRREMRRPKKGDVSFMMNFYPEGIVLLDLNSLKLVRKHSINHIMVHGHPNKKEKSTDCDSALIPLLCVHG